MEPKSLRVRGCLTQGLLLRNFGLWLRLFLTYLVLVKIMNFLWIRLGAFRLLFGFLNRLIWGNSRDSPWDTVRQLFLDLNWWRRIARWSFCMVLWCRWALKDRLFGLWRCLNVDSRYFFSYGLCWEYCDSSLYPQGVYVKTLCRANFRLRFFSRDIMLFGLCNAGVSPSGKAVPSGGTIRGFESLHPSQMIWSVVWNMSFKDDN